MAKDNNLSSIDYDIPYNEILNIVVKQPKFNNINELSLSVSFERVFEKIEIYDENDNDK